MSCGSFDGTTVAGTLVAPTGGTDIPLTAATLDTTSTGTVVNCVDAATMTSSFAAGSLYGKILCDPSCAAGTPPTIGLYSDSTCANAAPATMGTIQVDSIAAYTCGHASETETACKTPCNGTVVAGSGGGDSGSGSGASGLNGKFLAGITLAMLTALAMM